MLYFIFGGFAWILGLSIFDRKFRWFMLAIVGWVYALSALLWLDQTGSVKFSGVWTPDFGFFLLWMLVAGMVGFGFGLLMAWRAPRVYDVRAD